MNKKIIYNQEQIDALKKEGIRRQQNELPPGYMDKDKTENGDYYIFYSMMEKAKQDKNPCNYCEQQTE